MAEPKYQTVRDLDGNIYADLGSSQVRRIPNLEEYSQGVASGVYQGDARQLNTRAIDGTGGRYLGGYEMGDDLSLADATAGKGNFATQSRSIATTPGGGTGIAADGAAKFQQALQNITKTGSAAGPSRTDQIGTLRKKVGDIQRQAFERQTEYTPENLRNLSPTQQTELRRQRVTALSAEMGNYNSAIQILKDEEEAAKSDAERERSNALDTLNTYLKYGVLGDISTAEQMKLATTVGMDLAAIQKISEAAGAAQQELKEFNGNLYSVSYGTDGVPKLTLVQAGTPKGGGGGGGGGGGAGSESTAGALTTKQLDSYLNEFPAEFRRYIYSIAGKTNFSLTRSSVSGLYEQFVDQGPSNKAYAKDEDEEDTITYTLPDGTVIEI